MTLSAADVSRVAAARSAAIINALSALGSPATLAAGNRYAACVLDDKATYSAPETTDAIQLTALGSSNHGLDSWSFVARALAALVAGDAHAARHFAYYAELRAALAILASGGIGVFNGINFAIDLGGTLRRLAGSGTHVIVWDALDAWIDKGNAAEIFGASTTIGQVTLQDCLDSLFPTAVGDHRHVAGTMLSTWGFDLQQGASDRKTRNASSYNPHVLTTLSADAVTVVDFLGLFWDAFEPTGNDRFDTIDRHILRSAIEQERISLDIHEQLTQERYLNLDASVQALASLDFLNRAVQPDDHPFLVLARTRSDPASPLEMIARSALLSRAACSIARKHLTEAGLMLPEALQDWLTEYANSRGLLDQGTLPEDSTMLWDDISLARESLDALREDLASKGSPFDRWSILGASSSAVPRICEAERVALWGLIPE
jgi:hypothetical protein